MIAQPATDVGHGRPALRAFFGVAKAWSLNDDEQQAILAVSKNAVENWRAGSGEDPSEQTLERVADVLRIFAALAVQLPVRGRAVAWVRKPNKAPGFAGRSAVEMMATGRAELRYVRACLEARLV